MSIAEQLFEKRLADFATGERAERLASIEKRLANEYQLKDPDTYMEVCHPGPLGRRIYEIRLKDSDWVFHMAPSEQYPVGPLKVTRTKPGLTSHIICNDPGMPSATLEGVARYIVTNLQESQQQ